MKKVLTLSVMCFLCLIAVGAESGKFSVAIGTNTAGEENFSYKVENGNTTLETKSNLKTEGGAHSFELEITSSAILSETGAPVSYALKAGMHGNARVLEADISEKSLIINESMGAKVTKTELEYSGKIYILDNNIFSTYNLLPALLEDEKTPVSFAAFIPQARKTVDCEFRFQKTETLEIGGKEVRLSKYTASLDEKDVTELWFDKDFELVKLSNESKGIEVSRLEYSPVPLD